MKKILKILFLVIFIGGTVVLYQWVILYMKENLILKEVISRFQADSRIAEVLVTKVRYDEKLDKTFTSIKFLEYDYKGIPLKPKYFTFPGNIIQFQSLVIRFKDVYVRNNDALRGKSAYLFWKVFMLDGANTKEYEIAKVNEIPRGYKIEGENNAFEEKLWEQFWEYALNFQEKENIGVKNAQIEAPGTMFNPGTLYTIKIEHDGGMMIQTSPLPAILKGEYIPEQ